MNTYTRQEPEPAPDPAEQPKDPGGKCDELKEVKPPELKEPEKCLPDQQCECPAPPASSASCLDDLIAEQSKQLSEAESAKTFKAELESLLKTARAASLDYTREKYDKLVKEWDRQDIEINEFLRKLVCAVPCWKCLIECFVCPLLYEVRYREQKLWGVGDGKLYSEVHSLADLLYWHDRNRTEKKKIFDRVKSVLAAWEKPAQTIEKALADNAKLLVDLGKLLSSDATKIVYDVFMRLIPMHLVIAPPASSGHVTGIAKEYTQICEHDKGEPDDCCGPDVGVPSLSRRLLGPQPYLIDPKDYFSVICCVTKERYLPAKNAYATAQSAWESTDSEFKRLTAEIDEGMKSIEKNAKAAFPLDCKWQKKKPDDSAT
jgi:hypothetical protein